MINVQWDFVALARLTRQGFCIGKTLNQPKSVYAGVLVRRP
jgi:hypothetical protein